LPQEPFTSPRRAALSLSSGEGDYGSAIERVVRQARLTKGSQTRSDNAPHNAPGLRKNRVLSLTVGRNRQGSRAMEKIIEYKVTGGGNPKHLAEAVNQLIGDGFEPFGNVFQTGGGVFAANGKEGAGHKRRLSFNTACELGFRCTLDEWQRLMGAVARR
jgi:hypothetical protein